MLTKKLMGSGCSGCSGSSSISRCGRCGSISSGSFNNRSGFHRSRSFNRRGNFRSRSRSFFFFATSGQGESQQCGEQDGIFHLCNSLKMMINMLSVAKSRVAKFLTGRILANISVIASRLPSEICEINRLDDWLIHRELQPHFRCLIPAR